MTIPQKARRLLDLFVFKTYASLRADASLTYLNFVWWVLEPAFMMSVYYLVFSQLLVFREQDFVPFLLIGVVVWHWFSRSVMNCRESIIQAGPIITRIPISALFFPSVVIATDLVKVLFVLTVLIGVLAALGHSPSIMMIALPFIVLVQLLTISAFAFWLALLRPIIPDLKHVAGVLMLAGLFASGVFYSPERLPENIQTLVYANPVAFLIKSYREVLIWEAWPNFERLSVIAIMCAAMVAAALIFEFKHRELYPRIAII